MLAFDLVGIGNPVYDTIVTPSIKTDGRVLSGCSTNACLVAKKLGLNKVGLVGSIGPDFGDTFLRDMKHYGIDVSSQSMKRQTGGFHLIYDERGDRTLDVLGVADPIVPEDIPDAYLDAKFIIIGPVLGEVDFELVKFIRDRSEASLFLDPQGLVRIIGSDGRVVHVCDRNEFKKIAELMDFIKPNEPESETITGEHDPVRALYQLREMGRAIPIVTLAERGSILIEGDRLHRIPAFPTDAIDPTGAGDVYAGAFVTDFINHGDIVEAAMSASAAASLMVEQVGPEFRAPIETLELRKKEIRRGLLSETLAH